MGVTNQSSLSNTYQNIFSKVLLDHAINLLVLSQFGIQADLPKKRGAKVISFFRPAVADASQVQTLTEGVAISTFRNVPLTKIDVTLIQYGEATKITDIVTMTELLDALNQSIETMGEDLALQSDEIIRNALETGITTAGQIRYAGYANWAALAAGTDALGKLDFPAIQDCVTQLRVNKAPRFKDGSFAGVFSPEGLHDLLEDTATYLTAVTRGPIERLFNGEVGKFKGVRIIEATNPFQEDGADSEGTYDASPSGATIHMGLVLGRGAYGTPKLSSAQKIPIGGTARPSIIIATGADKADPLDQFMTAGWKNFWACKVLNENFAVAIKHRFTWS